EALHGFAQSGSHSRGVAGGTHIKGDAAEGWVLGVGLIDEGTDGIARIGVLAVLDHADNFNIRLGIAGASPEVETQRITPRQEAADEGCSDDGNLGITGVVGVTELAAGEQGSFQGGKVVGSHIVAPDVHMFVFTGGGDLEGVGEYALAVV